MALFAVVSIGSATTLTELSVLKSFEEATLKNQKH
jgi:hypothetical protein